MSTLPVDPKRFPIQIPPRQRTESCTSESSSVPTQRERRFSLTEMLGRRTSVSEAYKRYAGYTTHGGI
ncbi:unnamed protein product [Anisakis simplex]|uniref:Uncharacterized protein n=1 Tax=Anisakis simplex TaxID=6269 RepID=A0A0M3J100_ANISI|nr:unnamed protein product [Anisakis simplex]